MEKLKALWNYQVAELELERLEHSLKNTVTRKKLVQQQKLFKKNQAELKKIEKESVLAKNSLNEISAQSETLAKQMKIKDAEISETEEYPLDDLFLEDIKEIVKECGDIKTAIEMNRRKLLNITRELEQSEIHIKETLINMSKAKKTFDELKELYTKELEASKDDLERLRANVKSAAKKASDDLMGEYKRIKQHSTPPIVPYKNNRCQGCNMDIPSAHLQALKAGKRVVYCENCGRILYNNETLEKEEA